MTSRRSTTFAVLATIVAVVAIALTSGGERAVDEADGRTAVSAPGRPFAPDSFWNTPVAPNARLSPYQGALLRELGRQLRKSTPWINTTDHSTPVYTVGPKQRRVRVFIDTPSALYTGKAAAEVVRRRLSSVPIPPNAHGAVGVNHHLVIWQPSKDTIWELWNAHRVPRDPCPWDTCNLHGWHAAWGTRIKHASTSRGIDSVPTTATASGLPVLGGLIRLNEWRSGLVDHALAMAIPDIQRGKYVWPATRSDGEYRGPNAIPMGTRLRIDPAVDVENLPMSPAGKTIARAAQRYGIVIRDHADGAIVFYGEDPAPTGLNPYPALFSGQSPNEVLKGFPWDRLQVLAVP
jgi:hypothetical protein